MKKNVQFIILLFLAIVCSCVNSKTPLDKAIEDIESTLSKEELTKFSKKNRETALADIHFSYGMFYRNKYFWNPKDSTLLKYFYSLNVKHIDHMSGIVFSSLHRKLNNEPINLDEILEVIYEIQDKQEKLIRKNKNRALGYYKKYKVGDNINVRMPINKNNSASRYGYPEDSNWTHNDSLDLLITGIIKEKMPIIDSTQIDFKIEVLNMNKPDVKVLMESVKIGDIITTDLWYDIIEDSPVFYVGF